MCKATSNTVGAGLAALLIAASITVATEPASAAHWVGRAGGWHGGGWHGGGWRGGGWRGGGWRGGWGWRRGPGGGVGGAGGWAGRYGGGLGIANATGLTFGRRGDGGRVWNPGRRSGSVWYDGWWGPASTVSVVDAYPYDNYADGACYEVQPVYSAYGNYLGRQIINLCQ